MLVGMSRKRRRRHGQAWTPDHAGDTVDGITWGQVELEPEVSHWLEGLDDQRWAQALFRLDLLQARGALLGEPYTRQLSGKLRELRFYLRRGAHPHHVLDCSRKKDHRPDRIRQDQDA